MRPAKIFGKPTAAWKFGGLSECFTKTFGEFKLNTNKESYRTDQTELAYTDVPFDGPTQETFFTLFSKYHRFSPDSNDDPVAVIFYAQLWLRSTENEK